MRWPTLRRGAHAAGRAGPPATGPDAHGATGTGPAETAHGYSSHQLEGPPLSAVTEDLLVAEESLLDTMALTPAFGLVADPYLETVTPPEKTSPLPAAGEGAEAPESFLSGIFQAGPLAVGGLVANALNIVATVLVARLLTTRQYGGVAQLLGLFFVLSMPGSALLVGVLRRITAMAAKGHDELAHRWTTKLYRRSLLVLVAWSAFAFAIEAPLARALRLPDNGSVAFILIAGGVWALLCIDRAILQAHRRYAGLGLNLMIEIGVRTVLVLGFAIAGLGIWGYALGLLLGEIVAAAQARVAGQRAWGYPARAALPSDDSMGTRALSIDLVTALIGFALLGVLQNADIILVGRLQPSNSGSYAAISVASKALVFGAILLGSYVLPEAAIRWHRGEHALRQLAVTLLFLMVPSILLLAVALFAPKQFLTIFFSARLSGGAPAFATLVGAMACLGVTVVLTNYLFGAARRGVIVLLALGVVVLLVLIHRANGHIMASAQAELAVQGGVVALVLVAFAVVHLRFRPGRVHAPLNATGNVDRPAAGGAG
jgi:O-antigen/teichoic acid export membrane protein